MKKSDEEQGRERERPSVLRLIYRWLDQFELSVLIVMALLLGGLWLFVEISEEAVDTQPHRFDEDILLALREPDDRSDPIGPPWFEETVRDFTAFGGTGVLLFITLGALGYLILRRNYDIAWIVLLTVMGGFLITYFLKVGFDRPRPDLVPRITYVATASFPSGHSSIAAATYLTLGSLLAALQPRYRLKIYVMAFAVLLSLLVGFSRVYLGVHWPTDVIGGWTIGAVWAMLSWLVARWWRRRDVEKALAEATLPQEGKDAP